MAIWRVYFGTGTTEWDASADNLATANSFTFPNTFNLEYYHRRTSFNEQILDGQDGVFIDGESRRTESRDMLLTGLIKAANATATEKELLALETIAAHDRSDLYLDHIPTSGASGRWHVQHIDTRANRLGGNLLQVTLTLRTNITIL